MKFLIEKLKELLGITTKEQEALINEHARLIAEQETIKFELEQAKKTKRETEIKALFATLGSEYSETSVAPYFEFDDEQFAFISADLLPFQSKKYPAKSVRIH